MKTLTALVAGAAFLTSAGLASAETALPLNPNKSSQAIAVGGAFAGGTVTAIAAVGALFVVAVVAADGTTSTTTVSTLALP